MKARDRRFSPVFSSHFRRFQFLLGAFLLFVAVGCGSSPSGTDDKGGDDDPVGPELPENTLTILYTVDERGRLLPSGMSDGAPNLMGLWRTTEGFDPAGDFLILSGGNNWMGQTLSVYFEGASTVDVMKRMHYAATTIGFQEFIFGEEALRARASEAGFPFLSANLHLKATGAPPTYVTPSSAVDVNGMKIGLVGLTSLDAPQKNAPQKTEAFEFLPYEGSLNLAVSAAKSAGADVVVVVTNLCEEEIGQIIPTASQLGVAMIGGAYCGQTVARVQDGMAIVVPEPYFGGYGKVTFKVNKKDNKFSNLTVAVRPNSGGTLDEEVSGLLDQWSRLMDEELSEVVGYASEPIPRKSAALQNFIMDSWLAAFPEADIAQMNDGAIRNGIPGGDIQKGLFLAMMPFQNTLVELELTGAEVVSCLKPSTIMAGMSAAGGHFHADGSPLKMDSVYHVLTSDFLYGQNNYAYSQYDSEPVFLGVTYDQPPYRYVESLGTSQDNPLNNFLDPIPRR